MQPGLQQSVKIIECPRDAMQGWKHFIPTAEKVEYLNALLKVGFHTLDFGSFVSPKAIPQMADTKDVIPQLRLDGSATRLLAIIANTRGAAEAAVYDQISYLGFPFSISETFQMRNTNKTIAQSLAQVEEMQQICTSHGKELVIYISMGFGNPYGDAYSTDVVYHWVDKIAQLGVKTIAIADTVGLAHTADITSIYRAIIPAFPSVDIGAHFHSTPELWQEKIDTAYDAGCLRFDSAMNGIGGCPMAEDELVGNIATENLLGWCERKNLAHGLNRDAFQEALMIASRIFL